MKRVEWVLFDLGGVLVEVDQARIFASLAHKSGRSVELIREALLREVPINSDFITKEYLPKQITQEINHALGANLAELEIVESLNAELGDVIHSTADLLPNLRSRIKIGCLSNTNSIHWDRLLSSYSFMGEFDRRFASQIVGHAKPGAQIYIEVAKHLGVSGSEILFFDDREENVNAALKLGWHARLYREPRDLMSGLGEFGLAGLP
jgi:HAD superfamily hydrolase (TIGR01509 family)